MSGATLTTGNEGGKVVPVADAFTPAIVGDIAYAEARMDRSTHQNLPRYTGCSGRRAGSCASFAFRNSFPFRHKEKQGECSHRSASFV
jgi:hypothetical protein